MKPVLSKQCNWFLSHLSTVNSRTWFNEQFLHIYWVTGSLLRQTYLSYRSRVPCTRPSKAFRMCHEMITLDYTIFSPGFLLVVITYFGALNPNLASFLFYHVTFLTKYICRLLVLFRGTQVNFTYFEYGNRIRLA